MEQSSKFPLYRLRGARPQPLPDEGRRRSSMRGSLILVGVMMAWVIVSIGLALGAGPGGSSTSLPAALGQGVVVTPASGWSSAAGE